MELNGSSALALNCQVQQRHCIWHFLCRSRMLRWSMGSSAPKFTLFFRKGSQIYSDGWWL